MNPRLLLVEDDPHDVLFLKRAFKKIGWEAPLRVEKDGQEALDYLLRRGAHSGLPDDELPTHAILDLKLPRVSGIGILKALREDARRRGLPVLFLTSSKEPDDIACAFSLGCAVTS